MSKKTEEVEVVASSTGNQNMLYMVIIVLLLIIAVGGFFLGMKLGENNGGNTVLTPTETGAAVAIAEDITVTIYSDTRCTDCQTDVVVTQLKSVPVLAGATFLEKDFSESGVSDFLEENNITALPAAIFSTNSVGPDLAQYLAPLSTGEFSLALGATYDPFIARSDKGFLIADDATLEEIKTTAFFKGSADAKITWVEYTDVNCGYCKKMETDGTAVAVLAQFPEELNKTTSNFIGVGGASTQAAAEILECSGNIGGADVYNSMLSKVLIDGDNSEATMLTIATEQGVDSSAVKACLDAGDMKDRVAQKFNTGSEKFGITGTPGNVLINNETGEYEIVSGAYPSEKFVETVNKLLGNL